MVKLQTYFIDYQIHSLLLITSTLSTARSHDKGNTRYYRLRKQIIDSLSKVRHKN